MQPSPVPLPPQQSRINLGDLKSHIVKRLGQERSQQYFNHLNRLLSQKLSKLEFNKLCISTIGRENVALHNQLIQSIFRNAFHAKVPPPVAHDKSLTKAVKEGGPNLSTSLLPAVWSNGDILPPSPRKSRSGIRRLIKDRSSPLGQNGRVDSSVDHSLVLSDGVIYHENGELSPCDLKRPVQHHQGGSAEQPAKRQRAEELSTDNRVSVYSKIPVELEAVEDQEEVQQRDDLKCINGPLQAPLGIPFCPASVGGARRPLPLNFSHSSLSSITSYDSGELCSNEELKIRMEKIAQGHGLEGVTIDCASLLNGGLDAYLKQLIRSSVELVRARVGRELLKQSVYMQHSHGKPINGVWAGNNMPMQSHVGPFERMHEQTNYCPITLQDFRVAMELSPHRLGEDWPLLLEKISLLSFGVQDRPT